MSVRKIAFTGEEQSVIANAEPAGDNLTLERSYVVSDSARGLAEEHQLDLDNDHLVEFTFNDGTVWVSNPDTIENVFPEAAYTARSADGAFQIPGALRGIGVERGLIGDIALKLIKVFSKKAITVGVKQAASNLEKKALDNQSGLYKVDATFTLTKAGPTTGDKPFLLFLHGTASSSKGSFAELVNTPVWKDITTLYGANILAFQHESLTKSPLLNAVELAEQLPSVVELHLVSHSRGGLVGDVLSRFCNTNENERGFDADELAYLETTGRKDDLDNIERLKEIIAKKKINISRFVRVACPANGTILASKRLDNLLNITLNLLGLGTGMAASPVYAAFKTLIAAVIDNKNNTESLPGLEAMNPASPFIKVLNSPSTTIEIDNPLIVIAGNCRVSLNFKALLIIASKLFYLSENDLVVNTLSMYQGSKRRSNLTYLFDDLGNVDHFHYFKNEKTSIALLAALKTNGDLSAAGFKTKQQLLLAQGERGALLSLDGGAVFTNTVTGAKPIVVILPGIMGSNISVNNGTVWINYWQFLKGGLTHLTIPQGASTDAFTVPSIVGSSYRQLVKYLQAAYDVVTFPYDWRLPLTDAATLFNQKILELMNYRQPIKIIGHSMGGVMVRDFILKFPDTWQALNSKKDFRLLFLGSPLGGSFRIPAVLFGKDAIIDKLSKIDIVHTKKQLLDMFSKFPGLLSLLPLTEDDDNDFAKGSTWNKMMAATGETDWPLPVEKGKNLDWFREYRTNILQNLDTIDYTNVVYIAGHDKATPCGYRIDDTTQGKELVFLSTGEGDQSVTWESGIPKKMIAQNLVYYVEVTHGALANEPAIFDGISEILAKGATSQLRKTRPAVRGSEKIFRSPELHDFDLTETGVEQTLLGLDAQQKGAAAETENYIQVSVNNGHLKYASYPVLAGHFAKDGILNAEGAVDGMLNGALSERHRLGIYPGEIGTSEVIVTSSNTGIKGGVIVGLGSFGELTAYLLAKTVEQGATKYLLDANSKLSFKSQVAGLSGVLSISSLMIGSGYGDLSIENSVRSVLQGIQNANTKVSKLHDGQMKLIEQVEFIELYEDRALSCFHALGNIAKDQEQPLKIRIDKKEIKTSYGSRKRIAAETQESWWTRITVTMDDSNAMGNMRKLQFSVSTGGAREEKRDLFINPAGIESMLTDSTVSNLWSPRIAKTLFEILIPIDFKEQLKRQNNINWILDKNTASYPWELLQDSLTDARPLSVNAGMVRQLGTQDYRMRINAVAGNTALVVGEPMLNGFLPALPGAAQEGELVAKVIGDNGFSIMPLIHSKARDILQELHAGYKIIHLAGHGVFNKDVPQQSGMVIGENNYLTSADISNMSTVPELVFINCCYLGQISGEAEAQYRYAYKLAANIGTQLIENGVKAVVAAGWAVSDAAALMFAETFYRNMFEGECFGDAVRKARQAIYIAYPDTNTWGAYQCYGDPYYKLRDDQQKKKVVEKEFVIAEEAEIELNNLHNEIKAGNYPQDDVLEQLYAITRAVDMAGIRNANITEKEGLVYADMFLYDAAIAKFKVLLGMEKADFSVSTLEKYSNVRMKKYVADYLKASSTPKGPSGSEIKNWLHNAKEAIKGMESLLLISPTAERYNLLGSAYRRKGLLCKTEDDKLSAYSSAAYYYMMSYTLQTPANKAYAITNWYSLESILVIAGARKWGETIVYGDEQYKLPSKKEALTKLKAISDAYQPDTPNMDYWVLVELPNCKLCLLIVEPQLKEAAWKQVLEAYQQVWNMAGSKADKFTEIENLQLLADALKLSKDDKPDLQNRVENLKTELEKMI